MDYFGTSLILKGFFHGVWLSCKNMCIISGRMETSKEDIPERSQGFREPKDDTVVSCGN